VHYTLVGLQDKHENKDIKGEISDKVFNFSECRLLKFENIMFTFCVQNLMRAAANLGGHPSLNSNPCVDVP